MKSILFLFTTLFYLCSCTSYIEGSNNITVIERGVASYSSISVEDGINLVISNTPRSSVAVRANDNVHQYIETVVKGNTLVVGVKRGASFRNVTISVTVSGVGVAGISASGGSNVEVNRCQLDQDMNINLSGGSTLFGVVDFITLKADISGGSDINIQGLPAQSIKLVTSGGSKSQMQIETRNIDLDISGGGKAYVWVSNILNLRLSGGSNVFYKGKGAIGDIDISGGSDVVRKDW